MLVHYDFDNLTEYITFGSNDEMPDDTSSNIPLGRLACALLSLDYGMVATQISDLLVTSLKSGSSFPIEEVSSLFPSGGYEDSTILWETITKSLKNLYNARSKKFASAAFTDHAERQHKELFRDVVLAAYANVMLIQGYLDECESTPALRSNDAFEAFVESILEKRIVNQFKSILTSDIDVHSLLRQGNDPRWIVRQVVPNIWRYDDRTTIFSLPDWVTDFLISSVYYILSNSFVIKRCRNCGSFFIPFHRSDTLYCDDPAPQDKKRTCKEYGSQKLWYDRMKEDTAAKRSRTIYARKQMLACRHPDITSYQEAFDRFKAERKMWIADVKSGKVTSDEYMEWLDAVEKQNY